jgi:hypothetical protein
MPKLSGPTQELIAIGVFTGMFTIVLGIIYATTQPMRASVTDIQKPDPVPPSPYVPPPQTIVCLPSSRNYSGLQACDTQSTCVGCIEKPGNSPMECATVNAGSGELTPDNKLKTPLEVSVNVADDTKPCSGHGTTKDDKCTCDGDAAKDSVYYTGETCDMMHMLVDTPGNYCLPAYVNKCNPYTSNTLLTGSGSKSGEWTCECKNGYTGVFTQAAEGASCDTEVACGAQQPQLDENGEPVQFLLYDHTDEGDGTPRFSAGPVHPNRLTSYSVSAADTCTIPTESERIDIPGGISYTAHKVSGRADPTCNANEYTNECRVLITGGNVFQYLRGSGSPGDPIKRRVSPAFFAPVPIGLKRCPNGWTGDGSVSSPCQDPYNKANTLVMFDEEGQWNGWFTSLDDVRQTRLPTPLSATQKLYGDIPWTTMNPKTPGDFDPSVLQDPACMSQTFAKAGDYDYNAKDFPPDPQYCVGPHCEGASGWTPRKWEGNLDGPLVDENGQPGFVTGALEGGQCTCDGYTRSSLPDGTPVTTSLRAQYELPGGKDNNGDWWTCAPDTCHSARSPMAKFDPVANECSCPPYSPDAKNMPPYKTSIPWTPPNEPPVCLDDPCNDGGYASNPNHGTQTIGCTADADCELVTACIDKRCFFESSFKCTTDDQCKTKNTSVGADSVCKDGVCYFEDQERKAAGTVCQCSEDGTCPECQVGKHCNSGVCTPYCVCGKNYEQVVDDSNPMGYACRKKCDPEPGPCQNKGTCHLNEDSGEWSCTCALCWGGDRCTEFAKEGGPGEKCWGDSDCCTGDCDQPVQWIEGMCK